MIRIPCSFHAHIYGVPYVSKMTYHTMNSITIPGILYSYIIQYIV